MFDASVTIVFALAAAGGRRRRDGAGDRTSPGASRGRSSGLAAAAARIADGDLTARVPEEGPEELRALAESYNTMAARLAEQEADPARVHRQCRRTSCARR